MAEVEPFWEACPCASKKIYPGVFGAGARGWGSFRAFLKKAKFRRGKKEIYGIFSAWAAENRA
jgi:hypothetical protein